MFPLAPRGGRHAQHIGNKPEDAVISLGGDASFKVRATATAPAWVEWYRADGDSNTLLLGTNNNARSGVTLTIAKVQAADAGEYFAVMTTAITTAATTGWCRGDEPRAPSQLAEPRRIGLATRVAMKFLAKIQRNHVGQTKAYSVESPAHYSRSLDQTQ